MTWLCTGAGAVLILIALHDIFRTLWYPGGLGIICRNVFATLWRIAQKLDRNGRVLRSVGPAGLALSVVVWSAMLVFGWALVFLPQMPDGFHFTDDIDPANMSQLGAALYLSIVNLTTLGYGDVVPAYGTMRLLAPFEALVGFILLTAAIAWVLHIHPALARHRAAARRLSLMSSNETAEIVAEGDVAVAVATLDAITEMLIAIELDFEQYGETYYFRERDEDISLASTLSFVPTLIDAAARSSRPEVRHSGGMLEDQLGHLAARLEKNYLRTGGSLHDICAAYATDHHHEPRATD